jgi:hypothetical protein
VDAFEAAALKAITTFCEQYPNAVAAYPIGLFPAMFAHDAEWTFRTTYLGRLVGDLAEETLRAVIRYMNVAEPPELFWLKCASHRYTADTTSTHFKRNNPLVCWVSA